jgi:hypothetical protein
MDKDCLDRKKGDGIIKNVKPKQKNRALTTVKTARKTIKRQTQTPASSPRTRLETAHGEFIQSREGTLEYTKAWENLLDTLVEK